MPGLVGVVGNIPPGTRDKLLKDMAQALKHEDWYQVHLYADEGVGLGRVSLGILNPEPQPIWNEDHTLCIVMEGEVYDYEGEKQRLIERGHRFQVDNDPEYVLHLYEEYGEDFAHRLNGAFVAAIWDPQERRLLIVNDRLGLRPLYYAQHNGQLLFGAGARAVVADHSFSRRLNALAMAEFLSFQYVLGNKTLFEGVELVPPASIMQWHEGTCNIRTYWELEFLQQYENHSEDELIERWIYTMRQAVARRMRGDRPVGIQLSGGVDSRTIAAMVDRSRFPVLALSLGQPDSDDVRLGREVAAKLGIQHRFLHLKPDYLLDLAKDGVRLTDGMKSCVHMHALGNICETAQHTSIVYNGFMGGTIHGDVVSRDLLAPFTDDTIARMLFENRNKLFRKEAQNQLFTELFYRQIQGRVSESFRAALSGSKSAFAADKQNHFENLQADRRFGICGHELMRRRVEVRLPFADNDLVAFMTTVPPGLRQEKYLYFKAFAKAFPELAKIPYEGTGLPLISCFRDLRIRADRQIRWRLRTAGLKWVSERYHRHYADYNGWMRTVLRPWVEGTLLSRRTLERGYFNPEFIHNLMAEHMAGANHARKLGVLLTIELWHRLFLD